MQTGVWRTKDDRILRICDMSNYHLVNVMRFLDRVAVDAMNRNNKAFEECVRPIYWCMLEEIEDRIANGRMNDKITKITVVNNRLFEDGKPINEVKK